MPFEIIVASDTHGRGYLLHELEKAYPHANLFIHCGDIEEPADQYPSWLIVKGNNDFYADSTDLPDHRVIPVPGHALYVTHSHRFATPVRTIRLAETAKENGCDIVLYGHTHRSDCRKEDGVLEINPGSMWMSRDRKSVSYARILIEDDGTIIPEIIYEEDWPFKDAKNKKSGTKPGRWFW